MAECAYDDGSGGCEGDLIVCVVCRQNFCKEHASLLATVCGACEYNQADYERDYPGDTTKRGFPPVGAPGDYDRIDGI